MRCFGAAAAMFVLCLMPVSAQAANGAAVPSSPAAPQIALLDDDPAPLLGGTVAETLGLFGPPLTVFAVRGAEPWQDDVAFKYQPGFTFFLFGDRVWQLRLTAPYAGSFYGLFLGDKQEKVLSTLGEPYERAANSLVYRMPFRAYPVKLKLVFAADLLVDAYLYRADF